MGGNLPRSASTRGVPDREDDPFWHHFWTNKLAHLGRRGAADFASATRAYQQDYDIDDLLAGRYD
jgi:hypothetical protein